MEKNDIYIHIEILEKSIIANKQMLDWLQSNDDKSFKNEINKRKELLEKEIERLDLYKSTHPDFFI